MPRLTILQRQLDRLAARWVLDVAAHRPAPALSTMRARQVRWLTAHATTLQAASAAHAAWRAGLPHNTTLASLYLQARISAFRP